MVKDYLVYRTNKHKMFYIRNNITIFVRRDSVIDNLMKKKGDYVSNKFFGSVYRRSVHKKNILLKWSLCMMLVFVAACSKSATTESPPSSGENPPAGTTTEKPEYVIKYLQLNGNGKIKRSDETDIGKVIKDKFNIVFEYVPYAGNWDEKVNLMLAARDYPEILWIQFNPNFQKYAQAGALVALDDYMSSLPNFQQRFQEQIPFWRSLVPDNKLYKWEFNIFDNTYVRKGNDIGVRIDALAKQGYPKLLSEDDWIAFLKQAMKDFPNTPDGQKTIGMVTPFGEPWGIAGIAGIMYEKGGKYTGVAGNEGVIFNHAEDKFEDYLKNEYVLESFKWFNRLYREGILDPESFTDKSPQVQEKINSGRALSTWYVTPSLANNKKLIAAGHPEMQYITLPIQSNTQIQRKEKRLMDVMNLYPYSTAVITKNAKDPKRIVELLDWIATEEGQLLIQSGIEGKHYTVENGKRVPTEYYLKEINNPDNKMGFGLFDFLGRDRRASKSGEPYAFANDPELKDKLSQTKETMEAYNKLGYKTSDEYWIKNTVGVKAGIIPSIKLDPTSELAQIHQKMVDVRVKNTPRLIMAKDDAEFQKIWEEVLREYEKLNPQRVVDKYNEIYQAEKAKVAKIK